MKQQVIKSKILIIDDEPTNIDILSGILRSDYTVIAATSGMKGLSLAQSKPMPDLILLDIKMPGLDGYATCKELKRNPDTRNIPVIFITADADVSSEEKGLKLGAADYITKPFNTLLVKARIENNIKLKLQQDQQEFMIRQATSDLRQERERLKKSEQMYRSLMESAPDTVLLVNSHGHIELVNRAVEKMFGYMPEELVGQPIEVLVPDEHLEGHASKVDNFISQPVIRDRVTLGRLFAKRKSGEVFPVDISLSPVFTENGNMIIADVRDRSAEQRMQDQLRQAQKMEAIGQLTGGIAHDFNNILNSILGFSSLAQSMDEVANNELLKDYLGIIVQSGERARDLVKQMLAFSRGNSNSELQFVSLAPLMNEVVQMLRPMIPASIDIKINIDPDAPGALADPVQVNQIIMNLCINARDALNEKGTIELTLTKSAMENRTCTSCKQLIEGDYIDVSVKDNGEGISVGNLQKVFDPFFTTKEVGKGSGMGLSVVHGITHNHAGHIVVDSEPGQGTTFHLLLPAVYSKSSSVADVLDNEEHNVIGDRLNIMVVDDEEFICAFVETVLSDRGFKVMTFSDSQQALEYFKEHGDDVDLVITDQTMPKMTGYEISKAMLEMRSDLPIIMQTGHSDTVNAKVARAAGIRAFLKKPLGQSQLLSKVKELLPQVENV